LRLNGCGIGAPPAGPGTAAPDRSCSLMFIGAVPPATSTRGAQNGADIVAGGAVTAGASITVTVGAGGAAGTSGAAGGSGYVWIEYSGS
jgi:hypothetical protein